MIVHHFLGVLIDSIYVNSHNQLQHHFFKVLTTPNGRGFKLTLVKVDHEFESIWSNMEELGVRLNIASRDEHMPEAEIYIRTIKEWTWTMLHTLTNL
jgi:hypothetical protein